MASESSGSLPTLGEFETDMRSACAASQLTRADIRAQFSDQLKSLGLRAEKKAEFLRDLLAYFAKQVGTRRGVLTPRLRPICSSARVLTG